MFRLAFCLILAFGAPVMAKDGSYRAPSPTAPIDEDEAFWNSEEGQDITRMFEEFSSGKRSYDEVFDEYNAKWADKPIPKPTTQAPSAPYKPVR